VETEWNGAPFHKVNPLRAHHRRVWKGTWPRTSYRYLMCKTVFVSNAGDAAELISIRRAIPVLDMRRVQCQNHTFVYVIVSAYCGKFLPARGKICKSNTWEDYSMDLICQRKSVYRRRHIAPANSGGWPSRTSYRVVGSDCDIKVLYCTVAITYLGGGEILAEMLRLALTGG
jgi:hypothetical protein